MEIDKRSNLEHHVKEAVTESSQLHQFLSDCVCLTVNNF